MAHAALVSHLKVAVQFLNIRNWGCSDCGEEGRRKKQNKKIKSARLASSLQEAEVTHPGASGANQVDAGGVGEVQAVRQAGRAVGELQQQVVAALDDRTSLGLTHVADRHHLLRGALRTQRR